MSQDAIEVQGVKVAISRHGISPKMLRVLREGRYEAHEARQIPHIVEPGERIVELGGGLGFISAYCGRQPGVQQIAVYEADPRLIPLIRRTHRLNGVRADVVNAVVLPVKTSSTVPFYIRRDFWASSLSAGPYRYNRVIDVPVVSFADMLAAHQPTMLIVDIEGGEAALFDGAALTGIQKIYIELHPEVIGEPARKRLLATLMDRGFHLDTRRSTKRVVLLTRERTRRSWTTPLSVCLRKCSGAAHRLRSSARAAVGR